MHRSAHSVRPRPHLVQIATCLGFVVVLIDVSVVNVALPALSAALHAGVTGLQWVVNAYALVFASLLLLAGALGDRYGAKAVFMSGFAVFSLASIACGMAQTLTALIAWRLGQGLGAALLVPTSLSLLRQAFLDDAARQRAVGWWGAGGGIALAAGPVIGGLLLATTGWRSIFLINAPIGLFGLWLTGRYAPPSPAQPGLSLDLAGQAAGGLAVAALTFALTEASGLGWQHPAVLSAAGLALVLGTLFVWLEAGNPAAMLPPSLFRDATVGCATAIGMLVNLTFYGMVFLLSLYFQTVRHMTPQRAGLAFLPMMMILMAVNVLAGRLLGRVGERALAGAGLLLSATGYLCMLPALAAQSYAMLMLPMLLAGAGVALTIPTITNATLAAVPPGQAGIASGLLNAARQLGGVVGVACFGFLVRQAGTGFFMQGMARAVWTSVLLLLVGAGIARAGFRTRPGSAVRD